jgi:cytochrome c
MEKGEHQYSKCIACHPVEAGTHLMGSSLHGLIGRRAGTAEGFTFSAAMAEADFSWTEETLTAFLENPKQYVPGNSMPFGRIKNGEQLAALVCYIKQLQ